MLRKEGRNYGTYRTHYVAERNQQEEKSQNSTEEILQG
jgi:hypothetical protein